MEQMDDELQKENENIRLIRLNLGQAVVPEELQDRAVGIQEDIGKSIRDIFSLA